MLDFEASVTAPAVGQLVEVRSRRYVVTDTKRSALAATPEYHAPTQKQHLITLSSVDDEGAGEALEVRELLPAPGQPAFPRKFDLLIVDEAHNIAPSGTG